MDFEDVIEAMDKMVPEEKATKIRELTDKCVCGVCPSCPVQEERSLIWDYYCIKGSAKEQAGL